jgi:hypothetical protein
MDSIESQLGVLRDCVRNELEDGLDLVHRATKQRFARGRSHIFTLRAALKLKIIRTGRRLPIATKSRSGG